jgi:hypothetical protein
MDCDDSVALTFEKMQNSLMNWGNLIIGSGGSSKPIKCFYSLVSFKWDRMGKWSYEENHDKEEFQMVVPLPDGSVKEIEHVPISEPKETLGVFTCPNGNPSGALSRMKGKAQEWIDRAKEGKLTRRDVWFLLGCVFLAQCWVRSVCEYSRARFATIVSEATILAADSPGRCDSDGSGVDKAVE